MFEKPVITSGLGNNTAQTHKQQDVRSVREREMEEDVQHGPKGQRREWRGGRRRAK